jgi:hypothetical protein
LDMSLAAILGFLLLSSGSLSVSAANIFPTAAYATQGGTQGSNPSAPQAQAAPMQNSGSTNSPAGQDRNKPKPGSKKLHTRTKKASYSNCSSAPAALNPAPGGKSVAKPDGAQTVSDSGNSNVPVKNAKPGNSSPVKPCPPPKKIVRNGGADEPKIELLGGSPSEQASNERSTQQITAATEENLKKIAERQLTSSEQETVSQIKQFIEQSRQAAAGGDPERAYNLATKARLLSEQLIGP